MLFGAVTDQVSSHKLSSLAVTAFNGVVGPVIDLVAPASPAAPGKTQSTRTASPGSGSMSDESSQIPTGVATMAHGSASTIDLAEPSEPPTSEDDEDTDASSLSMSSGAFGRAPASRSGLGRVAGGAGSVRGATAGTDSLVIDEPAAGGQRLDELMEIVISDLDRDYGTTDGGTSRGQWSSGSTSQAPTPTSASTRSTDPPDSPGSEDSPEPTGPKPSSEPSSSKPSSPTPGGSSTAPVPSSDVPGLVIDPVDIGFTPPGPIDDVIDDPIDDLLPDVPDLTGTPRLTPPGLEAPVPGGVVPTPTLQELSAPEPASLLLLGTGLVLAAIRMRRRRT